MARLMNRRAALAGLGALAAAGVLGVGYVIRTIAAAPTSDFQVADGPRDGGMMGIGTADMQLYRAMFARHKEIRRTVEEIPGGVRTTTESSSPDLAAQLQIHVSGMYTRMGQGSEVMCMSQSLPILFRHATGYRRQLTITRTGVIAEETADDPDLIRAIREHAREVSGFVRDGMPAMMHGMMGPAG
ncbi:hypothetical protein [Mycolicibacterium mageritense]|uniref:Uncharacterized protein n=1 Tax=Mycolicibacterium mageritense TaxID=53462 RepID=A0AAI8TR81_MYCME|nr:hypothetical protein [Mycolicibacterium mageritense]TXI65220.1 MAG: hypothetical protein E6Q55_02870 [Mycolicibacterium mageritense]BDY27495.1 hypothetical protein hbim_01418 [Mycolicibacterium mageritense]